MDKTLYQHIISLMRQEIVPAIGCTEPIAVALAVAKAHEVLGDSIHALHVRLSGNIYKNAMGVGIPNTGMIGLPIAVALGATIGRADKGLEVLCETDAEAVEQAKEYLQRTPITIEVDKTTPHKLFIHITAQAGADTAIVEITDLHTHFSLIQLNDKILYADETQVQKEDQTTTSVTLSFRTVYEFATTADLADVDFLHEAARMNIEAANYSFQSSCGHCLGKMLHEGVGNKVLGDTLFTKILAYTGGACDARMSGAMIPVMSNTGSGNQGISATVPIVIYGKETGATDEQILRALTLSHLTVIYIKQSLGRLAALCGCVVAATGSACGITYLMGGGYEEITFAVKNMIGNITGMICDGAKPGCALKVTSGVSTAVLSAVLAMQHAHTTASEGIIDEDIDQTILNMTLVGTEGMQPTDDVILQIMTAK